MQNIDVLKILQLGAFGLAFLLALLSFYLVRQTLPPRQVDERALKSIRGYMFYSLILCLIGIAGKPLDKYVDSLLATSNAEDFKKQEDQLREEIAKRDKRYETEIQERTKVVDNLKTCNTAQIAAQREAAQQLAAFESEQSDLNVLRQSLENNLKNVKSELTAAKTRTLACEQLLHQKPPNLLPVIKTLDSIIARARDAAGKEDIEELIGQYHAVLKEAIALLPDDQFVSNMPKIQSNTSPNSLILPAETLFTHLQAVQGERQ